MSAIGNPWLKRGLSALMVLAILAAVVGFGYVANSKPSTTSDGPGSDPLRVNTFAVQWEDGYTIERRFVGRVEARRSSDLGFEIAGMVYEVLVEEGQSIEPGQVLARLDTDLLQARRLELIAARNQSKADFDLADITLKRLRGNASRGAATAQEIDDAEQQYQATLAALERTKASVASIDVEISKAQITSPFAAVVAERFVDEGRVIGSGTPVVRLLEREQPEVRVGIGGELIDAVQIGQVLQATIRERQATGTVTAILPVRELQARGVDVLIRLDADINDFREGDLARVAIPRTIKSDGFWVPTQSLTEGVRGLWSLYLVEDQASADDATLKRIDVELLHTSGDRAFVRGAIESEELIVANGLQRIAPGMTVRANPIGTNPQAKAALTP